MFIIYVSVCAEIELCITISPSVLKLYNTGEEIITETPHNYHQIFVLNHNTIKKKH